jgi:Rrf2 family protein
MTTSLSIRKEEGSVSNSRLSLAVHILTCLVEFASPWEVETSERIARSVNTNPVILRRLLGTMEKEHLVTVQRGANAGWKLARKPEEITLLDVYRAVESGALFALHHTPPNSRCRVGAGIGSALTDVYAGAQQALEEELARTTIADICRATLAASAAKGVYGKPLAQHREMEHPS